MTEESNKSDHIFCHVKFFDNEKLEWHSVKEETNIQPYSCKTKLKFIKAGFKRFQEKKGNSLFGTNLRMAQLYKDVEMAEVMTENSEAVGAILSQYEILEGDNIDDNIPSENVGQVDPPPVKKTKRMKSKSGKVKAGRIMKPKSTTSQGRRVLREKANNSQL